MCPPTDGCRRLLDIDSSKRLVATSLGGLNIYNPMTDTFERVSPYESDKIRTPFITNMLVDGEDLCICLVEIPTGRESVWLLFHLVRHGAVLPHCCQCRPICCRRARHFDGYEYINYGPDEPYRKLNGIFIVNVAEDRFKRLWIRQDRNLYIRIRQNATALLLVC